MTAHAPDQPGAQPRRPIRIGNASGFYGDRLAAMREMLDGGAVDVITGDYLAELTMLILWKAKQKDQSLGYARTFVTQLDEVLETVLERGIKVVVNAGGLNPAGLAERVSVIARERGLAPKVAWIEGDDLIGRLDCLVEAGNDLAHLDTGLPLRSAGVEPVTANAYLGAWGIVEALRAGADIVVCPRVTDASLVVGPAAWWHGWNRDDFNRLAGAVAAGHVIECGPQATGGNYSWSEEIADSRRLGYPIAEIAADGSAVITKHEGTGGAVTVGTVTAQLLYEIASPEYANPDVVARFDTSVLTQVGPDRVRIANTAGDPPTGWLKVAINYVGGYRNTMTLVLTGLDIEAKAAQAEAQLFDVVGGKDSFDEVDVRLLRFDHRDASTNAAATAHLQITVKDRDRSKVGRRFSSAVTELFLSGYPGFHTTTPPTDASEFGVYWPALVPAKTVTQRVTLPDGSTVTIDHAPSGDAERTHSNCKQSDRREVPTEATLRVPLGTIAGARSGDKGGNANVGLWTRTAEHYEWLRAALTVDALRALVPEAAGLPIRRYELPNLLAVNFVIVGLLGNGVADATRPDPQAKGLGEYVRSRYVDVPTRLLPSAARPRA